MGLFSKPQSSEVTIANHQLRCEHCEHTKFWERNAQIHTDFEAAFSAAAGESARCLVCEKCGHVQWFLPVQT